MLKFYTDGAATMRKENGNWIRCNGGSAMICLNENNKIIAKYKRGFRKTTNNYCELYAIYLALAYWEANYPNEEIKIYSDSSYCINMLRKEGWIYNWERNDWTRGEEHKPIENLPIIKLIWELLNDDVSFIKVKGHSGNLYNEIVDKMAVEAKEKGDWYDEIH